MDCVKGMTLRKTLSIAVLIGGTALGGNAFADPPPRASGPGYGMGTGMMGSGGMGPGMMGSGGMGHGMMGGYGLPPQASNVRALQPGELDLNSRAGQFFSSTCSRCHALPDPRQHTADQWPEVIARMEQNMRSSRLSVPDDSQIRQIQAFLEQHASSSK